MNQENLRGKEDGRAKALTKILTCGSGEVTPKNIKLVDVFIILMVKEVP